MASTAWKITVGTILALAWASWIIALAGLSTAQNKCTDPGDTGGGTDNATSQYATQNGERAGLHAQYMHHHRWALPECSQKCWALKCTQTHTQTQTTCASIPFLLLPTSACSVSLSLHEGHHALFQIHTARLQLLRDFFEVGCSQV